DDGTRYDANNEEALMWVHATLAHSAVLAFELLIRPLSEADKDRYVREGQRFARLFGIPQRLLPDTWHDFNAYVESCYSDLRVTAPAREMAGFILKPPLPWLGPVAAWYRLLTTGMLPQPLRDGFGFRFGRRER